MTYDVWRLAGKSHSYMELNRAISVQVSDMASCTLRGQEGIDIIKFCQASCHILSNKSSICSFNAEGVSKRVQNKINTKNHSFFRDTSSLGVNPGKRLVLFDFLWLGVRSKPVMDVLDLPRGVAFDPFILLNNILAAGVKLPFGGADLNFGVGVRPGVEEISRSESRPFLSFCLSTSL